MKSKTRFSLKIASVIFIVISMVCINVSSIRANTVLDCTEDGKPYLELHDWLTNETVKVIVDGEVIGEFTTDDDGYGEFTFEQSGSYEVSVQNSTSGGNPISLGSVTCNAPRAATELRTSPTSVELQPGQTQQFTVSAWNDNGNEVPLPEPVTWTAAGGTITTEGVYTAGDTPGNFTATVSSNGISASTQITIIPDPATELRTSPASVELQPGQTQQFTVSAWNDNGNEVPLPEPVTWTATGGTITTEGVYTAGDNLGEYTVTALLGNIEGTALVQVNSSTMISGWVWAIGVVALGGLGFAGWYFLKKN
jgi:hypothetical protein